MNKQLAINISSEIEKLLGITPWAILLVQFNDQTDKWPPRSKYEELFTSAGSGKMNMVDCFRDMSHGKIDASGSKVFGPYTLNAKLVATVAQFTRAPATLAAGDRGF